MPFATQYVQFGNTAFDAHQVFTYVGWAGKQDAFYGDVSFALDDCSCWADHPIPGEPDTINGGVPWVDPVTDGACWIDPAVPVSYQFLGFSPLIVDYGGFPYAGTMTDLVTHGARPGQSHIGPRSMRIVGTLWATTPEGARYGQDWLHRVLTDDCEAGNCAGTPVTFRRFCPSSIDVMDGLVTGFEATVTNIEFRNWSDTDPTWWMNQEVEIAVVIGEPWLYSCEGVTVLSTTYDDAEDLDNLTRYLSPDVPCGCRQVPETNCPAPPC